MLQVGVDIPEPFNECFFIFSKLRLLCGILSIIIDRTSGVSKVLMPLFLKSQTIATVLF